MKRIVGLVLFVALVFVASASGRAFKSTLTVAPATPVVGQTATLQGCGYIANDDVQLYIEGGLRKDGTAEVFILAYPETNANGCFSYSFTVLPVATNIYEVWLFADNNEHTKYLWKNYIKFTIV